MNRLRNVLMQGLTPEICNAAANGFAALADLDDNQDGKLDSQDAAWSELKVWQDAGSDGITGPSAGSGQAHGELKTLSELGIKSIATGYTGTASTDSHGNQHLQQGTFTKTDGSTGQMEDIWFLINPSSTRQENPLDVSAAIREMPNIDGMGNVASLWQTMYGRERREMANGEKSHAWRIAA